MPIRRIIEYPEAEGKTVAQLTVTNTDEFRGIEIAFTDETAMQFEIGLSMEVEPQLINWKSGNGKKLKQFPSVKVVA